LILFDFFFLFKSTSDRHYLEICEIGLFDCYSPSIFMDGEVDYGPFLKALSYEMGIRCWMNVFISEGYPEVGELDL